jgi:signal transduction histidine kinase
MPPSPPLRFQLADLIEAHQVAALAAWGNYIHQLNSPHYQSVPAEDLRTSMTNGLQGLVELLRYQTYGAVEYYIENISLRRLQQGFDIQEVILGMLGMRPALLPLVFEAYAADPATLLAACNELDSALSQVVGSFGQHYAKKMNRSLQEQQQHTSLILEVAQASSRSLEMEQVLQRVAAGIASALASTECRIVLHRSPAPGRPPTPTGLSADSRTLTLPIEANGRQLGLAVVKLNVGRPPLSNAEIALAYAISQAGALAIENARLYAETRQRLIESQSLQRVTAALLDKLEPGAALRMVCHVAQQLIGAQGGAVYLLEDNLWLSGTYHTNTAEPTFERLPVDGSFTGHAVRTGEPAYTNDTDQIPIKARHGTPIQSILVVPLRAKGAIIGAIDMINKPAGFTHEDVRVLSLFADKAAIAIENARLNQEVERIAVIEERNRIARELHDSVTQSLYGVTLYAEAATRLLTAGEISSASEHLKALRSTAREAFKEMRLLIFELRPPVLEKEGLAAALQARLDAVEGRAGLETSLQIENEGAAGSAAELNLPTDIEEAVYRIAQETLNNSLKHSQAHKIAVILRLTPTHLYLQIRDDGVGFDPQTATTKGGFGLKIMQERAAEIGAQLQIESGPGRGACITVEVNL